MDKIEKLMHIKTDKNQHVSPDTVFEMCCKINEIIDILNSRLFEPIITVHNQSQKRLEVCQGKLDTSKLEKQEEWRDRFYKKFVGSKATNPRELEGDTIWESTEYTTGSPREIIDFISELLSERIFNKEELKILEYALVRLISQTGRYKEINALQDKISKLLKEKE